MNEASNELDQAALTLIDEAFELIDVSKFVNYKQEDAVAIAERNDETSEAACKSFLEAHIAVFERAIELLQKDER